MYSTFKGGKLRDGTGLLHFTQFSITDFNKTRQKDVTNTDKKGKQSFDTFFKLKS